MRLRMQGICVPVFGDLRSGRDCVQGVKFAWPGGGKTGLVQMMSGPPVRYWVCRPGIVKLLKAKGTPPSICTTNPPPVNQVPGALLFR